MMILLERNGTNYLSLQGAYRGHMKAQASCESLSFCSSSSSSSASSSASSSSSSSSQLIALSVGQTPAEKRPYLSDFETWSGYFRVGNLIQKSILVVMEPCAKALQAIQKDFEAEDAREAKGIYSEEYVYVCRCVCV